MEEVEEEVVVVEVKFIKDLRVEFVEDLRVEFIKDLR